MFSYLVEILYRTTGGSGEISQRYSYLADGTKTSIGDYENCGYLYAGSLVYSADYGTVNAFESASFGGGRIVGTSNGTSEVHYFLTDHLGSTRVAAKVTPTGRIDLTAPRADGGR